LGGDALSIPAEVTDFAQVRAVADAAVGRFGRLDTWVHLAAVSIYAAFDQLTPEEFRRVIDVNLNGQAFGAMAAVPR
jgi:NAD(P)-dependent dehydrogenase (short-subunit alcohol dehydrogenase family)